MGGNLRDVEICTILHGNKSTLQICSAYKYQYLNSYKEQWTERDSADWGVASLCQSNGATSNKYLSTIERERVKKILLPFFRVQVPVPNHSFTAVGWKKLNRNNLCYFYYIWKNPFYKRSPLVQVVKYKTRWRPVEGSSLRKVRYWWGIGEVLVSYWQGEVLARWWWGILFCCVLRTPILTWRLSRVERVHVPPPKKQYFYLVQVQVLVLSVFLFLPSSQPWDLHKFLDFRHNLFKININLRVTHQIYM
jgi:hypothetical protein